MSSGGGLPPKRRDVAPPVSHLQNTHGSGIPLGVLTSPCRAECVYSLGLQALGKDGAIMALFTEAVLGIRSNCQQKNDSVT